MDYEDQDVTKAMTRMMGSLILHPPDFVLHEILLRNYDNLETWILMGFLLRN